MWANRHNSASLSDTDSIPDNPASDGYDDYQLEEYNESEESVKGDGRLTAEQERDKLQILLSESTQEIKRLRELAAENNRLTIGVVGGIGRCKHWTNLLASWVREELFPKVKFVTGDYDLEMREPNSIACAVRYHFPSLRNGTDEEFESFWFTYKCDINKNMSEKRNAVSTSIRKGFKRMVEDGKLQFLSRNTIVQSRTEPPDVGKVEEHPFIILVNYIFSRVVKYGDYASQKHKKNMASIMTVSDEAYALLVLENSWDVWTQNYTTGDTGNEIAGSDGGSGVLVKCLYTNHGGVGKRYGGWETKGYARFNTIYDQVEHLRESANSIALESMFMNMQKKDTKGTKTGVLAYMPPVIRVRNDLGKAKTPSTASIPPTASSISDLSGTSPATERSSIPLRNPIRVDGSFPRPPNVASLPTREGNVTPSENELNGMSGSSIKSLSNRSQSSTKTPTTLNQVQVNWKSSLDKDFMNCKRQGMAILVMEAMTKRKERHYLTVPKEHQEMLKANNNYKAFYQMTMEDLHDSDIPEYRRLDKKRFKKYFIECYAETSGNFSAYNIRERACHTEELNRRYAAAREENVHLPYEHYLTTGSSVRRNMMQFEGEMEEI